MPMRGAWIMAADERRGIKMSGRRKGGNSDKLVVSFYIDAPPLKYFACHPSPITPPLLQQHLAYYPLPPASLPVTDSYAQHW